MTLEPEWFWYLHNKERFLSRYKDNHAFYSSLYSFLSGFPPKAENLDTVLSFYAKARETNLEEVRRAAVFCINEMLPMALDSQRIFKSFFKYYHEFKQVKFVVAGDIELHSEHTATSLDFDDVKKIYADAYERVGKLLPSLATLINICSSRRHNEMSRIDWQSYLGASQANKIKIVEATPELSSYATSFNNHIRNAIDHESIAYDYLKDEIKWHDKDKQGTLTYAEFLIMTYDLMSTLANLICLNIFVFHIQKLEKMSRKHIRVPLAKSIYLLSS